MFTIQNPCCCCSLKTGALCVAGLEIVGGILFVGQALRFLRPDLFPNLSSTPPPTEQYDTLEPTYDGAHLSTYLTVLYIIVLVVNVFAIVFGLILLYAILRKLTSLMVAWIVFRVIVLFISITMVLIGYFIKKNETELLEGLLGVAINIWIISIIGYLRKAILLARGDTTGEKPKFKESKPIHVLRTEYTYKIPI